MNTDITLATLRGEPDETRADKAIRLLTTTSSPFTQQLDQFRIFYPAIIISRSHGTRRREIIRIIGEGGLKLYPALFDKLMLAMKDEAGAPNCPECGQHRLVLTTEIESAENPPEAGYQGTEKSNREDS